MYMLEELIDLLIPHEGVILDPCSRSISVAISAMKTIRKCVCIEKISRVLSGCSLKFFKVTPAGFKETILQQSFGRDIEKTSAAQKDLQTMSPNYRTVSILRLEKVKIVET